ncbi:hypothetical protein DYB25_005981 [Aphanomyces astaci]|uniref:Cyclic nucleotide-binding domain-containing protein n=1 Tax=Aphanomyces astaci TaxID=112090 RepID=A0A397F897_APHAT|nr:hypothetical protein DYB25_005981 [Aphanomyces astaci]RHY15245.1 hypothetical protein DYB36_007351 [Aphanomyces astaci]RHY47536.1 hypothetical protein DYB34_011345 [Aphanomyces astaci]RHY56786.1 hypothetical protein DYB38_006525 [Aphanomyces astaci]RHY64069.1 hypothetical protein DYB30_006849 [Aphanomyces astaci]
MGASFSGSKVGLLSYFHHESAALKRKEAIWGTSLLAPLYSIRSLPSLAAVSNDIVLTPRSPHVIPDDMHLIFIYSGHITATVLDVGKVSFMIERARRNAITRRRSLLRRDDSLAVRLRYYAVDREHATEEVMLCRRGPLNHDGSSSGGGTYLLRFVASKIRSHEVVVKSLLVTQVEIKAKSRAIALPPIVPSSPKGTTWGRFNSLVPLAPRRTSAQTAAGGAFANSAAAISYNNLLPHATAPLDPGNVPITQDCAAILQKSPYFGGIAIGDLKALSDLGTISIVQTDCVVMQEREDGGHEMFVVLAGDLRVCVRDQDTKVLKPVATLHSGSCMGEMTLLLRGPRSASVTAISNCMLVSIERSTLLSFLRRQPQVEAKLKSVLVLRLLQNVLGMRSVPMFEAFQYDDVMKVVPHCFIENDVARGTEILAATSTDGEDATSRPTPSRLQKQFRIILSGTVEIIPAMAGPSEFKQSGYAISVHVGELLPGMDPLPAGTKVVASTECVFLSMYTESCWGHLSAQTMTEALIRWSQANCTVEMVLRHPGARQFYLRYLTFEFSEENLQFVIAVQVFKLSPTVVADAKAIVAEYILESSPKQINVEAKMRHEIVAALRAVETTNHINNNADGSADRDKGAPDAFGIFDKAVDEITTLMRKDSFPRFKKTPFFKDMLAAYPLLDHQAHTATASAAVASGGASDAPGGDDLSDIGKRFRYVLDQVFAHRETRREFRRSGTGSSRDAFAFGVGAVVNRSKHSSRER